MSTGVESGRTQRRAISVKGTQLLLLSFSTLGIIYSDLGTSPLYVLNGIWLADGEIPSHEDVLGGVSAIVWALTLLPLIKHVILSLYFGTKEGEGGSFALYQGLYPREESELDSDRTLTGDSMSKPSIMTTDKSKLKERMRWPLLFWCLFGTSLTMADGIFTPAVSVTSAVGGIAVVKESVSSDIIPISIAILLVLFFFQQLGTARLSFAFSPVAVIWFLLIAGCGIYNITTYPGIFRAFDPSRAVLLFVRTRNYDLLAGVLLAITGCEAVFANLGQFNALSIRISFVGLVYPALILAYLGQGARLIVDGESVLSNIFYNTIPGPTGGPLYWIVFVFAILATLIASQAMITATFSLVQQVINMKGLMPLRMYYTSETIQGQVFVPAVSYILMIVCIIIVGTFNSSAAMTNAYGFAVATVMFTTSIMIAIQSYYVKKWPIFAGVAIFIFFGFFDGLFWGASLKKVPHGAWVPLMIGVILMSLMSLWTWEKGLEDHFDGANRKNLRHFIFQEESPLRIEPQPHEEVYDDSEDDGEMLSPAYYFLPKNPNQKTFEKPGVETNEKKELMRIPTCSVFHKIATGPGVPHTFVGFIRQWPALPRVVILLSVCVVPVARVALEDRYEVNKVRSVDGFYSVTYYIGFRDSFDVQVEDIINRICTIEMRLNPKIDQRVLEEIRSVFKAATHVAPHYHVSSRSIHTGKLSFAVNWTRAFFIESCYRRLATMLPETANWLTSADEIIRVGINAVI